MRTGLVVELLILSSLLAGCMGEAEFAARLVSIGDRIDGDAAAAHRCADELRAVAVGDPFVTGAVLEMQNGMSSAFAAPPLPAAVVARRAQEELARRERAVEAARNEVRSARSIGPAALGNALEAERLVGRARDRLCGARDVATTVVAMKNRRPPSGMVAAVK